MEKQSKENILTVEYLRRTLDIQKAQAMEIPSDCHWGLEVDPKVFHGVIFEKLVQNCVIYL